MLDNVPTGVIKKEKIIQAEPVMLGESGQMAAVASRMPTVQPQAKIVGQNESGAIIEVVCSCGQRLQVVCEFPPNITSQSNEFINGIK